MSPSKYNGHTESIVKTLKLLKIKYILTLQELNFYYKYKHNKLHHYLKNLSIWPNTKTHIYVKRIQMKSIYQRYDMNMLICQRSLIVLQLQILKSIVFRDFLDT